MARPAAFDMSDARYIRAWYMVPGMSTRKLAKLAGIDSKTIRNIINRVGPYSGNDEDID